jgi:hypothetical protein
MWTVIYHPGAEHERLQLPTAERVALQHAVEKLVVYGPTLPYPHQSAVRGAAGLRELRPRAGHSPWRGLYGRIGDILVIAAIAPEAQVDRRGFDRAVLAAVARLQAMEA